MKKKKINILVLVASATLAAFLVFGQACSQLDGTTGESSSSEVEKNNGDYYTGITGELAKSVSVYSDTVFEQSFEDARAWRGAEGDTNLCERIRDQTCSNGFRRVTYNDCRVSLTRIRLTGYFEINHSDSACLMDSQGDERISGFDLNYSNRFGQQVEISSENHFDYRGNSIGGGIKETRTAEGYSSEVIGRRSVFRTTSRGVVFDHSQRSLEPTVVSRTNDDNVIIKTGSNEIIDNLNRWTAAYSATNLTLQRNCCHPISGKLEVSYSGKFETPGTLEYHACGKATLTIGGNSYELELDECD